MKNARAALNHAATFSAWKHRQISADEAELMFRAAERTPDKYPETENVLFESVGDGVDETKKVLEYWRSDVDRPRVILDLEDQLERRRFDVTTKSNGMVAGEFSLPKLEGESLLTALDTLMPPPSDGDTRTTTQRRADALGDLARGFLEGAESPIVGCERPHLNVHVEVPGLRGEHGGLHETADGFVLDPFHVSQLACDASVTRIVFGPNSEVLDVGRKTRVIPAGLRRAVVARDRHCVAPGCRRYAMVRHPSSRRLGRRRRNRHHQPLSPRPLRLEPRLEPACPKDRPPTQVRLGLLSFEDLQVQPLAGAVRGRSP